MKINTISLSIYAVCPFNYRALPEKCNSQKYESKFREYLPLEEHCLKSPQITTLRHALSYVVEAIFNENYINVNFMDHLGTEYNKFKKYSSTTLLPSETWELAIFVLNRCFTTHRIYTLYARLDLMNVKLTYKFAQKIQQFCIDNKFDKNSEALEIIQNHSIISSIYYGLHKQCQNMLPEKLKLHIIKERCDRSYSKKFDMYMISKVYYYEEDGQEKTVQFHKQFTEKEEENLKVTGVLEQIWNQEYKNINNFCISLILQIPITTILEIDLLCKTVCEKFKTKMFSLSYDIDKFVDQDNKEVNDQICDKADII